MAHHEEFDPVRVNNAIDRDREVQRERERLVQEARREQQRRIQEAQYERMVQEATREHNRRVERKRQVQENQRRIQEAIRDHERFTCGTVEGCAMEDDDPFDFSTAEGRAMEDDDPLTVAERLRSLADLYDERQAMYGDNYKRFGDVMLDLFPEGLELNDEHDFNRAGLFVQMVYKLTRYAAQFHRGGHPDSLDDLSVYTQMLREIDADQETN